MRVIFCYLPNIVKIQHITVNAVIEIIYIVIKDNVTHQNWSTV